jgi:hypothetical protein
MNTWNLIGCTATSLLLGVPALGESVAVSVVDLGCGTANCAPDSHADIIRHDSSTGEITLHYMTQTGLDLIESDFTLNQLILGSGNEGTGYSAGNIIFNSNGTNGSGASAKYEVNGELSGLELASSGSGYDQNLSALDVHGVQTFPIVASLRNVNGTFSPTADASGTTFIAPFPGGNPANANRSWFTAFRIDSTGLGGPPNSAVRMKIQSFNPLTDPGMGEIVALTDQKGSITSFLRAGDAPNNDNNWLHNASQSIPEDKSPDPNLYYFNQQNTNGFGDIWWESFGFPQPTYYFTDNNQGLNEIEFSQTPIIRFYRGGDVMDVSLDSTTDGFTSEPVFHGDGTQPPPEFDGSNGLVYAPNHNSSEATFRVSWNRRGPISEITDFNPGSGYDSVPAFVLSDPDGQGVGASISLDSTEAFTGGPRKMVYADSNEKILLPGSGWKAMPGDFDGDGTPDLFWWSTDLGASMIWILRNGHIETTSSMPLVDSTLVPVVADLDDNGKSEVFWWDGATGSTWVWEITPGNEEWISSQEPSIAVTDLGWELVSKTQRFGRDAILWQNRNDGTIGSWSMSRQSSSVLEIAVDYTWSNGDLLIPGANWEIIGSGDLNGDGSTADLLWHSDDAYDRIAIWMIGFNNFLEGDYLSFNGQEVTIDAELAGIGTYTANRHPNLIWNDGDEVLNWEMARSDQSSESVESDSASLNPRDDVGSNSNATADETSSSAPVLGPLAYRLSSAWSMNEDGLLSPAELDFFDGYPALPEPDPGSNSSGSSSSSPDASSGDSSDIPDLGDILDDSGSVPAIPDATGGITVPSGVNECDYLCLLDKNDPDGWPPEFQTAPPDVIQGIWDILVDGLLENYGCDPCPGPPVGACCNEATGTCLDDLTEAECTFPGTRWLGVGSTCDGDCN